MSTSLYNKLFDDLKIAAKAKTDIVGNTLVLLLASVINHGASKIDLFLDMMEIINPDNKELSYPIEVIVDKLAEFGEGGSNVHDMKKYGLYVSREIFREYRKVTVIKRFIGNIDTWDIYRLG